MQPAIPSPRSWTRRMRGSGQPAPWPAPDSARTPADSGGGFRRCRGAQGPSEVRAASARGVGCG